MRAALAVALLCACSAPQSSLTGVERCGKVLAHAEALTTLAGVVCALTGSDKCQRYTGAAEMATGAVGGVCQ